MVYFFPISNCIASPEDSDVMQSLESNNYHRLGSKKMAYSMFIQILSIPPVSDIITSYTFSLTTLQSLFNICEIHATNNPYLYELKSIITNRFNIITGKSYFLFMAHGDPTDAPCHYCGKIFGGNNFFHYSQHLTSLQYNEKEKFCTSCSKYIPKYHTT